LLWEGQLTDDVDLLLVAPAIWESDNDDYNFGGWSSTTASNVQSALNWPAIVSEISATGINPVRGGGGPSISKTGPVVDHPIGMSTTVYYSQYYLVLTRKKIEETLSSSTRVGGLAPGVIAVALSDQATLDNFGGAYTIYLRVERVP
jgi:hypothetical protein